MNRNTRQSSSLLRLPAASCTTGYRITFNRQFLYPSSSFDHGLYIFVAGIHHRRHAALCIQRDTSQSNTSPTEKSTSHFFILRREHYCSIPDCEHVRRIRRQVASARWLCGSQRPRTSEPSTRTNPTVGNQRHYVTKYII